MGNKPDQHIADIRQTDAWPPKATPQVWLYKPCPPGKIPLVGQRYLMKVWREAHHADRLTYEEWKRHASWLDRAQDRLRHAFPRWWEKSLGQWGFDRKAQDPEVEMGVLSHSLSRGDLQQPTPAKRNRHAIDAIPKKTGDRVEPDLGSEDREEVWGLFFEEGFAIHRLFFYFLILYFLASLAAVLLIFL